MAGGSELAAACDLVYVAEDAQDRLPGRAHGQPARHAVPPLARRHAPRDGAAADRRLDRRRARPRRSASRTAPSRPPSSTRACSSIAERVAKIPSDLQQLNKRCVHRAMDIMGVRAAIRAGSELQALATHQPSVQALLEQPGREHEAGLRQALLEKRDDGLRTLGGAGAPPGDGARLRARRVPGDAPARALRGRAASSRRSGRASRSSAARACCCPRRTAARGSSCSSARSSRRRSAPARFPGPSSATRSRASRSRSAAARRSGERWLPALASGRGDRHRRVRRGRRALAARELERARSRAAGSRGAKRCVPVRRARASSLVVGTAGGGLALVERGPRASRSRARGRRSTARARSRTLRFDGAPAEALPGGAAAPRRASSTPASCCSRPTPSAPPGA